MTRTKGADEERLALSSGSGTNLRSRNSKILRRSRAPLGRSSIGGVRVVALADAKVPGKIECVAKIRPGQKGGESGNEAGAGTIMTWLRKIKKAPTKQVVVGRWGEKIVTRAGKDKGHYDGHELKKWILGKTGKN